MNDFSMQRDPRPLRDSYVPEADQIVNAYLLEARLLRLIDQLNPTGFLRQLHEATEIPPMEVEVCFEDKPFLLDRFQLAKLLKDYAEQTEAKTDFERSLWLLQQLHAGIETVADDPEAEVQFEMLPFEKALETVREQLTDGLSEDFLWELIHQGAIDSERANGVVLVRKADLESFLNSL